MKKFNLEKQAITLNENMNKKTLYVNSTKADLIVKDMDKQFDCIAKSLEKINTIINKCVYKKTVKSDDVELFLGWSKVCDNEAVNVKDIRKKFKYNYNDDVKNYAIKLLDERIASLERTIANMDK